MKKYAFSLIFLMLLSSAAVAADDGAFGLGLISGGVGGSIGGIPVSTPAMPVISMKFSDKFTGDAGFMYNTQGKDNSWTLLLRGAIQVAEAAGCRMYVPLVLGYESAHYEVPNDDDETITAFVLRGGWGFETNIKRDFTIGADLYIVSIVSPSEGDSSTTLFTGAVAAHYYFN